MSSLTLAQARALVRVKSDSQNQTDRHPDSEIDQYINDAHRRLWARLAQAQLLKSVSTEVITANGSAVYDLPSDFFMAYGVFEETNSNYHRRLAKHNGADRPFGRTNIAGQAATYDIASVSDVDQIQFYPQPSSGTYIVQYVAVPTVLSADSDTFEYPLNWEEAVIYDAAFQVLEKDDLPRTELYQRLQEIHAEIDAAAASRDLMNTYHIRDVRNYAGRDPADQFDYQLPWGRGFRWKL